MASKEIEIRVTEGDASTYIERNGLEKATSHPTVAIIGEDIDLIVILIALAPAESDIYFTKPGMGTVEAKIISTRKLQKELSFSQTILLLHAFSGCDTTSAIYRKSKASTVNLFKNQLSQMKNIADIFYNPSSTSVAISQDGEKMFLAIYRAPANEHNLNNHRYAAFLKSSTKVKSDLSSLLTNKVAAEKHSFGVYLQLQQWLNNQLPPDQCGWVRGDDGSLFPVTTNDR
ncbi:hypothetical protein AVEN_147598-1 [Araneus ventricosus]|uniref:Uncharacterized protein n=1 Tax=Araneus ventricosus TaxID=182803 RepID=A0A4Y2H4T3_ARAVE|nr:hypothetical protein AVEN_147598-1 [Araneus ventricosus]